MDMREESLKMAIMPSKVAAEETQGGKSVKIDSNSSASDKTKDKLGIIGTAASGNKSADDGIANKKDVTIKTTGGTSTTTDTSKPIDGNASSRDSTTNRKDDIITTHRDSTGMIHKEVELNDEAEKEEFQRLFYAVEAVGCTAALMLNANEVEQHHDLVNESLKFFSIFGQCLKLCVLEDKLSYDIEVEVKKEQDYETALKRRRVSVAMAAERRQSRRHSSVFVKETARHRQLLHTRSKLEKEHANMNSRLEYEVSMTWLKWRSVMRRLAMEFTKDELTLARWR
jgi:hypothetical protein